MIIEFSGLPKSGKSTTIGIVRDYYLRKDVAVQINSEGARMCPFSHLKRIEIASWTANRALNSVLESSFSSQPLNLFLQDRGLFDSLAFFELLYLDHFITLEELEWADKVLSENQRKVKIIMLHHPLLSNDYEDDAGTIKGGNIDGNWENIEALEVKIKLDHIPNIVQTILNNGESITLLNSDGSILYSSNEISEPYTISTVNDGDVSIKRRLW